MNIAVDLAQRPLRLPWLGPGPAGAGRVPYTHKSQRNANDLQCKCESVATKENAPNKISLLRTIECFVA